MRLAEQIPDRRPFFQILVACSRIKRKDFLPIHSKRSLSVQAGVQGNLACCLSAVSAQRPMLTISTRMALSSRDYNLKHTISGMGTLTDREANAVGYAVACDLQFILGPATKEWWS